MDSDTGFITKNWLSELVVFHSQPLFLITTEERRLANSRCEVKIHFGLLGMGMEYLDSFVLTTKIANKY